MGTTRTKSPEGYEQLTMLAPTNAPLQFRLDERTRRRGLAHIAEIRRQLAEQASRRETAIASGRRHLSSPRRAA